MNYEKYRFKYYSDITKSFTFANEINKSNKIAFKLYNIECYHN